MKTFGFVSIVALAVFTSVILPRIADAWAQTPGKHGGIFWPSRCYMYSIQRDGSDDLDWKTVLETVRASYRTWESVPCASFAFEETEPATVDRAEFNIDRGNANLIVWRESTWDEVIDEELVHRDPSIIALTSVMYDQHTDEILDVDIEINGVFHEFAVLDGSPGDETQMDLQGVLTHEIGHTLGLDHSPVLGSVMSPYGGPGETSKRTLSQDDIDGMCALYPELDDEEACHEPYCGLDLTGDSSTCQSSLSASDSDSRCSFVPPRSPFSPLAVLRAAW